MSLDDKRHSWHLSKQPVFAALSVAAIAALADAAELHERPRKSTLYRAGDPAEHVFFVHGGRVSVLHAANASRPVSLAYHGPADFFGESCIWTSAPRDVTAVAATSVLYSKVPRLALDDHPVAQRALLERAIARRDAAARRLCTALTSNVTGRLAAALVDLAEHGLETEAGRGLPFVLAHRELAAFIGTTRETVSHELRRLEVARLIRRQGRQILLCDIPRLRALAEPPSGERIRAA